MIEQHTNWCNLGELDGVDEVDVALGELESVGMVGYCMGYQVGDEAGRVFW